MHTDTRRSPHGKVKQRSSWEPGGGDGGARKPQESSSDQPRGHFPVPSASHSTIHKEFAEVHFGVTTLGQELLRYVLEISVVLTNFGGNILPLYFT